MPAPTTQEVLTQFRKPYSKKYCMHPNAGKECSGKIVRAHTIQRNGGLSSIAENGQVLHLTPDFNSPPGNPTLLVAKPLGLKEASTFTGFCSFHDNKTFEPIEKYSFQSNQEHTFLLGYRAKCRELFGKRAQKELLSFQKTLDRGMPLAFQEFLQREMYVKGAGIDAGLRDTEKHKESYDEVLLSGDYSKSSYYVVRFGQTPEVMCSSVKFAAHDFYGNLLQNL